MSGDTVRTAKQYAQKHFKTSGIQLNPPALEHLAQLLTEADDPEELVLAVIDEIETTSDERRVSLELLQQVLASVAGRTGPQGSDHIQVLDAFDLPAVNYDPVRKAFHRVHRKAHILGDAKSKVQLYVERYNLVLQRVKRNPLFRATQFTSLGGGAASECELTELKALLGTCGERRFVLAFLTRLDEGRYALEDLSARLPADLCGAEQTDGWFTDNCIVVAEGELRADGVFAVAALGLPPPERRQTSRAALQGLDFFGGRVPSGREVVAWRAARAEDRVVVLSDVWLDRPETLKRLHTVFEGYAAMEAPPSLFVLAGSFQSYDANAGPGHYGALRERFAALGRAVARYPALRDGSTFVLVPGPADLGPAGAALPRPPLPKSVAGPFLEAVPGAVLATNPCRVRHGPSELVIFRADLQHTLRGLAILPPAAPAPGGPEGPALAFQHACATVLQQSHLCPVPLDYQPVFWEHDRALYVYPSPDALILADAAPAGEHQFDTCSCINPGSFAVDGTFAAYNPVTGAREVCDLEGGGGQEQYEEEPELMAA